MITEDLGLRWGASSTIDVGDDQEALNLLYRAGCRILFIGLETLNQENLKWIGKKYVSERYIEQLHRIRENGICVAAFFTLGLDGDDWFTFKNLFDFIRRSRIALPILNLLLPAPGTKIFERLKKEGRLLIKNEEDFLRNNILYNTPCNRCFFVPKQMSIEEAEERYLDLVRRLSSFPETLRRSAIMNPFIAIHILFMNIEFRREYKAMVTAHVKK